MFTLSEDTRIIQYVIESCFGVPKRKMIAKPFKIRTSTFNSQAAFSDCDTIQTEDNIQQSNIKR